jgi:ArsR family transcriptional regulator, lead/cadmium/zinc/bismuth-responsive transcriptional repressor
VPDDRCELLCLDLSLAEAVRAALPELDDVEAAAHRARALADPTRLRVAAALASGGELCGCDLAWVLGRAQNLVSHHLKVLREAGLVESRRDGRTVFFGLKEAGRELLASVLAPGITA